MRLVNMGFVRMTLWGPVMEELRAHVAGRRSRLRLSESRGHSQQHRNGNLQLHKATFSTLTYTTHGTLARIHFPPTATPKHPFLGIQLSGDDPKYRRAQAICHINLLSGTQVSTSEDPFFNPSLSLVAIPWP